MYGGKIISIIINEDYYKFFPFVCLDSFNPFIKKQINRYIKEFSHYLYMRELENTPSKFRRSKSLIECHCRSGITKEVSFAVINGLNPSKYVDFNVVGNADRCDIVIDSSLRIDITAASILSFKQYNENDFSMTFSLHENKLSSIIERSKKNLYIANEIAFLDQKIGNIYYLGRIRKDILISLEYKKIQKRCFFNVKGKKVKASKCLSSEIILM